MVRHSPDGPRERLASQGPRALADEELLAILLGTGTAGCSARVLAHAMLAEGGLPGLARASVRELRSRPGIGAAKAATVLAAVELGRRLATRRLREGDPIRGPEDVFRHFHARLRDAGQEQFLVILLDGRHRMIGEARASEGTLTASLVHPREVFRPALRDGAAAIVLVHNHPSGDPSPSAEDRAVTRRLVRAGELLGIQVLDHVVVAERGWCSLREEGGWGES